MIWRMRLLAKVSLAFSFEAQTLEPPAESWVGSAIDALDTMRRLDLNVVVVSVVVTVVAEVEVWVVVPIDGFEGVIFK